MQNYSKFEYITKVCYECKQELDLGEFSCDKIKKYGKRDICKLCDCKKVFNHTNTYSGFISMLIQSAKKRTNKMIRNNRNIEKFELSSEILINKLNEQNHLCYYSGMSLIYKTCSSWKASIERLDPNKGYTIQNSVIIINELNTASQWSIEKIKELIRKIDIDAKKNDDDLISKFKDVLIKPSIVRKTHKKVISKIDNNIQYWKCNNCNIFKIKSEYKSGKNKINICKKCLIIKEQNRVNTVRGFLQKLLTAAKYSSKSRSKFKNRSNDFAITFDDLVEKAIEQKGKCYYSNVELIFNTSSNWECSLERKNPKIGYTKDNIALVCWEFNTGDNTVNIKNNVNTGSAGWTKEKFNFFIKYVRDKYK